VTISFVAAGISSRTTGGTTLAMTLPAGLAADDLLIAFLQFGDNVTLTVPTGWSQFSWSPVLDATTAKLHVLYKVAVAGEAAPTVSWVTNAKPIFQCLAWRGVDTATPFEASNGALQSASASTIPTPSVNNTGAGDEWAVTFHGYRTSATADKGATFTPPAGLTERADSNISAAGSAPWLVCETTDSNGAVAAGSHSYTATCSGGVSTHKWGVLLYLNPGGAAPPPAAANPAAILGHL
jgi:hypothetical protein